MTSRWSLGLVVWCALAGVALAQPSGPLASTRGQRDRAVELSVLGGVVSGGDLGSTDARVTLNGTPTGAPGALFTTRTRIERAPLIEGRVGVRVLRGWWAEGGVSMARPDIATRLTGDMEGIPDATATAKTNQFLVDAALQHRWAGRRVQPFVMGGGGYGRYLDEPRTTVSTGPFWYGGGGVLLALAPDSRGFAGRLALRGDVRAVWMRDGLVLNEDRPVAWTATGGVSMRVW